MYTDCASEAVVTLWVFICLMEKHHWPKAVVLHRRDYGALSCLVDPKFIFPDHMLWYGVRITAPVSEETLDLSAEPVNVEEFGSATPNRQVST